MKTVGELRLLDLFSGIGGFSLAADLVGGFRTIQFVEKEPYCHKVLQKHWPNIPIHNDICTFYPPPNSADVVSGGFPCTDISVAGKQAGIQEGTRSGLFHELMRIVCMVRPRYVVLENVSAITSNGLDTVLGALAKAGFDAEWACIPASAVGACHHRDRWWCVAYTNNKRLQERNTASIAGKARWPRWRDAAGRLDPDWQNFLSEPIIHRGNDGLRNQVDRLRALGNAVVPQVAMIPLQRIKDIENSHCTQPKTRP